MQNPQLEAYIKTLVEQRISLFDAVQSQTLPVIRQLLEVERKKIIEQQKLNVTQSLVVDTEEGQFNKKVDSLLRDVINTPSWYGLRLLHKACVRGSLDIIECLLSYGADPNISNDNGETPLHFAARRGDVCVLELLFQSGAQVESIDKKGRHASHHAATTGNIKVLQWLEQIQSELLISQERVDNILVSNQPWLELRDEDGRTPLFLACEMGHNEVVRFLLKRQMNKLSVLQAVEHSTGNTCLHAALLGGFDEVIYLCVTMPAQNMGLRLAKTTNKAGETLVQMFYRLRFGTASSELVRSLGWIHGLIPRPPNDKENKFRNRRINLLFLLLSVVSHSIVLRFVLIFLTLVSCSIPIVLPPLLIHLAEGALWSGEYETWFKHHYLLTSTFIYFAGSLFLLCYVRFQSHRVTYSSRAPNPIWCTSFLSGIVATSICFFLRIAPVLYHHLLLFHIFGLVLMIILFLLALSRDPGWVTENHPIILRRTTGEKVRLLELLRPSTSASSNYVIESVSQSDHLSGSFEEKRQALDRYCAVCEQAYTSDLVKHCKLCDTCVFDTDHHCLYIMRCVAHKNIRIFLWFTIVTLLCMLFFLYSSCFLYFPLYCNHFRSNILLYSYCSWKSDRAISTVVIFNIISAIWGVKLVYQQCQALGNGGGAYFNKRRTRLPLKLRILNIVSFMFLGRFYYVPPQFVQLQHPGTDNTFRERNLSFEKS